MKGRHMCTDRDHPEIDEIWAIGGFLIVLKAWELQFGIVRLTGSDR